MSYKKKTDAEILKAKKQIQKAMGKYIAERQRSKFSQKNQQLKHKLKNAEENAANDIKSASNSLKRSVKGKLATKVETVFKQKGQKITEISV